jgi:hypothetical protein
MAVAAGAGKQAPTGGPGLVLPGQSFQGVDVGWGCPNSLDRAPASPAEVAHDAIRQPISCLSCHHTPSCSVRRLAPAQSPRSAAPGGPGAGPAAAGAPHPHRPAAPPLAAGGWGRTAGREPLHRGRCGARQARHLDRRRPRCALGLFDQLEAMADPDRDGEGKALEAARQPGQAPRGVIPLRRKMDNDPIDGALICFLRLHRDQAVVIMIGLLFKNTCPASTHCPASLSPDKHR